MEKKQPVFRPVLFNDETATTTTNRSSSSHLQLAPNVKRRFPQAIRIGAQGLIQLQQQRRRHWISPISRLEELFHNPFVKEKRLKEKMEIRIQPWKPLVVGGTQLPSYLSSLRSSNKNYGEPLLRSPERDVGLTDAPLTNIKASARIKTKGFGLKVFSSILPKPFIRSIYLPLAGFRDMVDPDDRWDVRACRLHS